MEKHRLLREFAYNGIKLPDPNPEMSLEQVREVYSPAYPELTTAAIEGPAGNWQSAQLRGASVCARLRLSALSRRSALGAWSVQEGNEAASVVGSRFL
jgi:PRTRC genetic system protein C